MKMFHYLLFPLTVSWHLAFQLSLRKTFKGPKATEALFASGAQRLQLLLVLITQAHLAIIDWLVINKQWKNMAQKTILQIDNGTSTTLKI